ncbi:MAG: response regulator [Polyangiales bacterium]
MSKQLAAVRVLVVDDDRAICDYMETFLSKDGFEVKTLSDPSGAPEEVKVGGYHLVVLDLMMPKMDGLQVLERIRKVDNDVAVVIFTGYPSLETAVQSMKLDAVDYL